MRWCMPLFSDLEDERKYIASTLQRVNDKYHIDVVFVHNTNEMEQHIKENPSKNKIGFVIKPPFYMHDPGHFSPLYFERVGSTENFMQFDSMGSVYLLPDSDNPAIVRRQYYSPFQRQTDSTGCFEDGVTILRKCFQEKSLVSFCEAGAVKDEEIKVPSEDKKTKHWMYRAGCSNIEYKSRKPVKEFYKLTTLPARFLTNIEHYGTLRHFRETEPEKFNVMYNDHETVLQHIQRKGTLRADDKNLPQDESKKEDIKGQDFRKRKRRYQEKTKTPGIQKEEITLKLNAIDEFEKSDVPTRDTIRTLLRFSVPLDYFHNKTYKTLAQIILSHPETTPEDINFILSQNIKIDTYEFRIAASNLDIICFSKLLDYAAERLDLNWLFILEDSMRNSNALNIMRAILEKHAPKIINQLSRENYLPFGDNFIDTLFFGTLTKKDRRAQLTLLNEFGIDPLKIAKNLDAKRNYPHFQPKLLKVLRDDANEDNEDAVKIFFSEHPPKSGSFWSGKDLTKISLEEIVRHALGSNKKGFLGGYSGADTKKALCNDYGVQFDNKFFSMTIEEKVCVVSNAINNTPQKSLPNNPVRNLR